MIFKLDWVFPKDYSVKLKYTVIIDTIKIKYLHKKKQIQMSCTNLETNQIMKNNK